MIINVGSNRGRSLDGWQGAIVEGSFRVEPCDTGREREMAPHLNGGGNLRPIGSIDRRPPFDHVPVHPQNLRRQPAKATGSKRAMCQAGQAAGAAGSAHDSYAEAQRGQ